MTHEAAEVEQEKQQAKLQQEEEDEEEEEHTLIEVKKTYRKRNLTH